MRDSDVAAVQVLVDVVGLVPSRAALAEVVRAAVLALDVRLRGETLGVGWGWGDGWGGKGQRRGARGRTATAWGARAC